MTERERGASAETDLERAAKEYARVVRRVRGERAADAAWRRGAVEAVHTEMFRAVLAGD